MDRSDTTLGGADRTFPVTTEGLGAILRDNAGRALEVIAQRYWKPIYTWFRISRARSNEDAKDLAQAFFAWLLESGALRNFEQQRASFRTYLRVLLRGFATDEARYVSRIKRGGGIPHVRMDDLVEVVDPNADPDARLDAEWARAVARVAIERARERLVREGRERYFRVFELHDMAPEPDRDYAAIAARLGIKRTDVANFLFRAREVVRQELRAELADTTRGDAELDDEWKALFG